MVRWLSGIPLEKSSRGNARGGRTSVTSRFTSETASAEAPMMPVIAKNQKRQSLKPEPAESGKHDRCRQCGEQQDGAEVKEQAEMPARPAGPRFPRQTAADRTLQTLPSVIDQVVADMRAAVVGTQLLCSRLRENNGFACHRHFTARTALAPRPR